MENGAQNALDTALARKARLKALKGKKDKNEVNRPEVDTEQVRRGKSLFFVVIS